MPRDFANLPELLFKNVVVNQEQDIKDFLNKPFLLDSGSLAVGDTVSTFTPFTLFDSIFAGSSLYADKVRGFLGFKADTVFTLQINATRFIQGRYMLCFYPSGGAQSNVDGDLGLAMHRFSLTTRTQCPHVEIDLACETQVVMKVPYVSSYPFYPLRSIAGGAFTRGIGIVQMHPYQSTSAPCDYSLYVHFENVRLVIPTIPQMADAQLQEQKSVGIGPVESTFRKISRSTKYAKKLPVIGTNVSSLGWVADIFADVASVWGWSKAHVASPPVPMFRNRAYQNYNVDGGDVSAKLSLSCKNQISTIRGLSGDSLDEMAFDYIKTIPAFFQNISWSNQTRGTSLATFELRPDFFKQSYTDNGNSVSVFPPVNIPIIHFNKYRGSFTLTFKFVKTEFHSGRLAIVFIPYAGPPLGVATATYANSLYNNRTIIDLRYGNEFTFTFPYTSEFGFLKTDQAYGRVQIFVENILVFPTTVSSTVNILCEVSGASDLEYAHPDRLAWAAYFPSAPQASNGGQFECDKIEEMIGSSHIAGTDVALISATMGERFTSYRQLIKRMEIRPTRIVQNRAIYMSLAPFCLPCVDGTGAPATPFFPLMVPDTLSTTAFMYAMVRGSIRIKTIDNGTNVNPKNTIAWLDTSSSDQSVEIGWGSTSLDGVLGYINILANPYALTYNGDGVGNEVQIPMYSGSYAYPVVDVALANTKKYRMGSSAAPNIVLTISSMASGTDNNPVIMRGAGDDYECGFFISTVPMILTGATYSLPFP